jgi:hypothetical protein
MSQLCNQFLQTNAAATRTLVEPERLQTAGKRAYAFPINCRATRISVRKTNNATKPVARIL